MRRIVTVVFFAAALVAVSGRAQAQQGAEDPAAAVPAEAVPAEAVPAEAVPAEAAADPAEAAPAAEMTDAQRAEYAAALREMVRGVRDRALGAITARIEAKQQARLDGIAAFLSILALSGALLLLLPLRLRRRYPGRTGVLVRYSAVAALLFFLAVNLFAGVLFLLRGTQGALGEYTNPQVRLVESTLDLIEDKADEMAEIGPLLIEPTLASLNGETDEPILSIALSNLQKLRNDVAVFGSIGRAVKKLDWLLGALPILLTGVALLLFARMARPTLAEIVRLPERAAQGERGAARHTVRVTLRNVWAEARATFCVIGILIGLTLVAAILLGFVLEPAVEIFLAYLAVAFLYVQVDAGASSFWILVSLSGSLLFLVLNLAVVLASSILYLARAQRILQLRFGGGVPLGVHRRFWRRGTVAALWVQLLPVLYIAVAVRAIGWFVEWSAERVIDPANPAASSWPFLLASGPALFLAGFGLVFWLGRGGAALGFLARYRAVDETRPRGRPD